jgi:Mycothiol-dependent nitroreductase Rv2466c
VTARWVVDEVAPNRDLNLIWQPISLLFKNDPDPSSDYYAGVMRGHQALRIMEAIRAEHGDGPADDHVSRWYWQCATRIHHDRDRTFEFADALTSIDLDPALAEAAHDTRWDTEIRTRMDDGLALVGDDVGTPIIAFTCDDGTKRGIFGPVITRVPDTAKSLQFWDAMVVFTTTDGFWEIKRTRTERPEFGTRPAV